MKGGNSMATKVSTGTTGASTTDNRYGSSNSLNEWGLLSGYYSNDFNSVDPSTNLRLAMNDGTNDLAHKQSWSDFDRFYAIDLDNELPSGRHYIFICRPDLYLVENGSAVSNSIELSSKSRVNVDPYFTYLAKFHPEIIASLTGDFAGLKSLKNMKQAAATGSGYGNSRTTDGTTVKVGDKSYTLSIHSFIPYLSHSPPFISKTAATLLQ